VLVYFAPEDQMCSLVAAVAWREDAAIAASIGGDIVVAGGRDELGRPLDDVIVARDDAELVTPLDRGLEVPTLGATLVATGERSFALFGGARSDANVSDHWVPIDLEQDDPVRAKIRLDEQGVDVARAYHSAVTLPDGRVWIAGGCQSLQQQLGPEFATCAPGQGNVLQSTYLIDPSTEPPTITAATQLLQPRYGHEMFVARDGAVFVIGGRNVFGEGIATIERTTVASSGWTKHGPVQGDMLTLGLDVERNGPITGAAVLEGGLIVVVLERGALGWISETAAGNTSRAPPDRPYGEGCPSLAAPPEYWNDWCDGELDTPGCFWSEGSGPVPSRHRVLALPDERVLADAWLLSFPHLSTDPSGAVDLSQPLPGEAPPPRRSDAAMVMLADGTALVAGGREPDTLDQVRPFFARLRPALDGPDERVPQLALPAEGSLVLHDPLRIAYDAERKRLVLTSEEQRAQFPRAWAHVRSFRSASFRFEATLRADGGAAHLVLSQGALTRASIRFGDNVEMFRRDAEGHFGTSVTCSPEPFTLQKDTAVRVDVRPGSVVVHAGGQVIANCPGIGEVPSAIGLGITGNDLHDDGADPDDDCDDREYATLSVSGMQLTRI
jgi:galactose oxidase-like protein